MGMVAILVMWPWQFEGIFVPPPHGGSTENLASVVPVASEEKMFENVDDGRRVPTCTIRSPMSLRLGWANKIK